MGQLIVRYFRNPVTYEAGLKLQRHYLDLAIQEGAINLLLLQHNPVFTAGIRNPSIGLASLPSNIPLVPTDRGGLITFHGPGQLVAYPILKLSSLPICLGPRLYIDSILKTMVDTCNKLGLSSAYSVSDPHKVGIWTDPKKKIGFVGIHVGRGGSVSHGISLNITKECEEYFKVLAEPCGIPGIRVSSVESELNVQHPMEQAAHTFSESFTRVFQFPPGRIVFNDIVN